MTHYCQTCGAEHAEDMAQVPTWETSEPAAEITETTVEEITDASVEIARIEGDTAVKIAKIEAGVAETEVESRISALEGELRGMREALDRLAPEPEPAPEPVIVAQDVAPEPEPEMPVREERSEPRAPRKPRGFFG